ncbi:MAG: nucleotidyltransferase family protein [Ilumatobacteraceae bacterium]
MDAVVARLRGGDASIAEWPLDEVQRNGLATGLTALAASVGVFDDASAEVRAYVDEQRGQVAARAERFRRLTPQVLGALAAADVPVVPVKGAILGGSSGDPAVWPHPELRPMSDIDLLVPPRHRAAAAAVLVRAGSTLHASDDHEDTFLAWGDGSVGRTDGESADHNGRIEVHPGWVEFLHGYSVHGFDPIARAHRRADGQWRLDDASFAVHVIGHLASTVVRAEVRAVNVLDVWFLHDAGLDWDAVGAAMRDVDVRLTAPGLWAADRFLHGVVPSPLLRRELDRLGAAHVLDGLDVAAVLREPTQRTTSRWRSAFADGMAERAAVARQLGRSAVARLR